MKAINKDILKLAVPSILANITVPLVGMADIAIAGHLEADAATLIGGIAIGSMLFDLLYWNFGFLRVGTGGLAAQAYGSGINIRNSFSGRFPTSSSFVWFGGQLSCSFTC